MKAGEIRGKESTGEHVPTNATCSISARNRSFARTRLKSPARPGAVREIETRFGAEIDESDEKDKDRSRQALLRSSHERRGSHAQIEMVGHSLFVFLNSERTR
jgi:hypothetical protein